jgi:hypothetical protein
MPIGPLLEAYHSKERPCIKVVGDFMGGVMLMGWQGVGSVSLAATAQWASEKPHHL